MTVSPFFLGQRFDEWPYRLRRVRRNRDVTKGPDVLLTAFVPTLMFDPFLTVPVYAPLQVLDVNVNAFALLVMSIPVVVARRLSRRLS